VAITQATTVSDELIAAFARLVRQLSTSAQLPTRAELEEIVSSPAATILLARGPDGQIIGSLTLVVFRTLTGVRAWIEDVVVDEAARGQGAGEELVREAIRLADESGARTLDLTSRPSREAAHALYEKVGFHARETNVYRYDLG
jgi:ribosomal protein S18 acetylase RimI-like enzyme